MTTPAVPTDSPLPPDVEGFWAWEKGHFPRPATPLTQELLYRAITDGFSRAMQEWACPFGTECRAINYYGFLAIRPFDLGAEAIEDRSARYQQILGEVLPRMGHLWTQEWLPAILPGLEKGRTTDYTTLSPERLLNALDEMLQDFRERWTIHGYINPTATLIIDIQARPRYAAPAYSIHRQEAAHVTSLSDRRHRICHSPI